MNRSHEPWRAAVASAIVLSQLLTPLASVALAQGTVTPAPTVQRGQDAYEQARFNDAIAMLRTIVDKRLVSGGELQKAREYLARSYVKKGDNVQANETFKAMLKADPAWRPDAIRVPPDEAAVFDQALKEYQAENPAPAPAPAPTKPVAPAEKPAPATKPAPTPKPAPPPKPAPASKPAPTASAGGEKKSKKMLWIAAGGLAVIGGTVAVLAGGGKKPTPDKPLDGFPATP